ncbi:hypothetical protein BLNAU_3329 [Blattamonas nauphoetae]|uniref:Protein kinase domain-containing protein n=1 Tax=Blattamonas nauphoetae TaxID=2049346 RepID=A0ABQ9YDR2_9EUKA|nr:hypothetical protein BLNAU_3329 [Blattamonas nauphoetae]
MHSFENCRAEKGAGIFFDGELDFHHLSLDSVAFNNWNQVGLGTDLYFAEGILVENPDSIAESLQYVISASRPSSDLTKHSHVFFEADPSLFFDLFWRDVKLEGSSSALMTPIIDTRLHSPGELTPYLHRMDEEGNLLETPVFMEGQFYAFERGFCTNQHLVFFYNPLWPNCGPIAVAADYFHPSYDPVMFEIGADATIEFKEVQFNFALSATMMLLTDPSAIGNVDGCTFTFIPSVEQKVALFEVVDGTLTVKNTVFTLKGSEAPFGEDDFFTTAAPILLISPSTSPSASPKIVLDTVTFKRIKLGEGVEGLMVFDITSFVSLKDVEYVDCNQTSTELSKRIVVAGWDLERVEPAKFEGFSFLTASDTLNWGIDTAEPMESTWREVPLFVVLFQFKGPLVHVHPKGKDLIGCGDVTRSCRGLIRAGKNLAGDTACTLTVVESSFLDGVFDPETKSTSVQSSAAKSTIAVEKGGVIVNSLDGGQAPFLTLSRLSFSLPPSLDSDPLMKSLGGELKIDTCWFVCSSVIDFSLVSATRGVATINELSISNDLRFSKPAFDLSDLSSAKFHSVTYHNLNELTFIRIKGSSDQKTNVSITLSTFKGSESKQNEETEASELFCSWETGLVRVTDCSCDVSWTTFSHLRQGAIHATNSDITFQQSSLTNNGISTVSFPSARQNIRCIGASRVSFETSPVGTGEEKNAWVSGDSECVVEAVVGEERAQFFEPTLDSNKSSSTLNKKGKKYEVSIVGTTLIPCGLSLEVFENGNQSTKQVLIPLSEIASEWNETSLALVIPTTRLSSLSNTPQWLGRISFGGQHTTDSFEMKLSARMAQANEMKKTLPWLIPLIVVLSILLVVGIILFVCCRRRKQKIPTNASELQAQELVEDEKMEVLSEDTVQQAPNSALSTLNSKHIRAEDQHTQLPPVSVDSSISMPAAQYVEALSCAGKMEMALVRKQDTLYARLHTEQGKKIALTTESVRRQLLRGIQKIWETDKRAPILTKLSSHVVMVDFASNVFLNVNEDQTTHPQNEQNKNATLLEQKRWSAPELDDESGGNSKGEQKAIDHGKAAVFSLGLVLREIETGLVPFGEVDAVNAQRQVGVGSALAMDGIADESMKDVIAQCISINPDERPTLTELNEFINPRLDGQPLPSNCS